MPAPDPFPSAADLARPQPERRGDLLAALVIAGVVVVASLPAAWRDDPVHVPRFEPLVLDPNRAARDDLHALPGIGKVLARRIAAEAAHAPFRAPEDLLRVHGVGPKLLAAVRPHLRFAPTPAPSAAGEGTPAATDR